MLPYLLLSSCQISPDSGWEREGRRGRCADEEENRGWEIRKVLESVGNA